MSVRVIYNLVKKDEYFTTLKDAIERFRKDTDANVLIFDFACVKSHVPYIPRYATNVYASSTSTDDYVTKTEVASFLEANDVFPAFKSDELFALRVDYKVYKNTYKGKSYLYCIEDNSRWISPRNRYDESEDC